MDVLAFFKEMMENLAAGAGRTVVLKIGGNSLDEDPGFLPSIAQQVAFLQRFGWRIVLIHGGGPQIDRALTAAGIVREKAPDGRRPTSAAAIQIVAQTMNAISRDVAAALRTQQVQVYVTAERTRPFVQAKPLAPEAPADDHTGLPDKVEAEELQEILARGDVVVMHSLGYDGAGRLININADDHAMAVAIALKASRLILATNVPGVLDEEYRPLPLLTPSFAAKLIAHGVIAGGMIPKVESAFAALRAGVQGVSILNGHTRHALLATLLSSIGCGTLIVEDHA